jgi:hypothetical protein
MVRVRTYWYHNLTKTSHGESTHSLLIWVLFMVIETHVHVIKHQGRQEIIKGITRNNLNANL